MTQASAPEISGGKHMLELSAHEAMTSAARLISFTNAVHYSFSSGTEPSPILDRQTALCIQDLIHFALHVRKYAELSGRQTMEGTLPLIEVKTRNRPPSQGNNIKYINDFWTITNRIIHSQNISLVSFPDIHDVAGFETFDCLHNFRDLSIRECFVRSDREGTLAVSIEQFVLTFVEKLWPTIDILFPRLSRSHDEEREGQGE
ncbi:MAG: hypothetical protein WEB85_08135 [Dongiaceae bacterium]